MNTETKNLLTPFDAKRWQALVEKRAQAQGLLVESSVCEEKPLVVGEVTKPAEVILFDTHHLATVRAALVSLQKELAAQSQEHSVSYLDNPR